MKKLVKQQRKKIIKRQHSVLVSIKDQEVFFNAIMNPPQPNDSLTKAARKIKRLKISV
jgi:uncharacterized protein (DUF1778 family)